MNEAQEQTAECTQTNRVPHDPAVQRIIEAHGELSPGMVVDYPLIEEAMYEERDSGRGRAIINKWRRYLFNEHNVVIRNVPKVGYEVCDTSGRLMTCVNKEKQARKRIRLALAIANTSSREDMSAPEVGYVQHLNRTYASILLYNAVSPKALELPSK
jgi:hypothetical protein